MAGASRGIRVDPRHRGPRRSAAILERQADRDRPGRRMALGRCRLALPHLCRAQLHGSTLRGGIPGRGGLSCLGDLERPTCVSLSPRPLRLGRARTGDGSGCRLPMVGPFRRPGLGGSAHSWPGAMSHRIADDRSPALVGRSEVPATSAHPCLVDAGRRRHRLEPRHFPRRHSSIGIDCRHQRDPMGQSQEGIGPRRG